MSNVVGIQSIDVRPAVPSGGFLSRNGVGFWREVAASAGRSLKASGDDVNLPPSIGSVQLSISRDLSQITNENRKEAAEVLGELLANEIRGRLVEWRAKYLHSAEEFERRLGIYAINAEPAKTAAKKACDIAIRYMEELTESVGAMKDELKALLIQVAGDKKLETGWGGGVGNDDADVIMDAMRNGNVREKISHLDLFIENVMGTDVLKKVGAELKKAYSAARKAGINVRALARRRKDVHKLGGITVGPNGELVGNMPKMRFIASKPRTLAMSGGKEKFKGDTVGYKDSFGSIAHTTGKGMDMIVPLWAKQISQSNLPRSEVLGMLRQRAALHGIDVAVVGGTDEEQIATLVRLLGDGNPGAMSSTPSLRFKTSQDTLEFEEGGVRYSAGLSEREKRLKANPRDPNGNLIPWLQGSLINVVNEEHEWVKQARKRGMPVESAVSGTTGRVMNTARFFNFQGAEFPALRLAILGYLINIKAHSFHEIMTASQGFPECRYVPGRDTYERIAPLTTEQLKAIAPGGKLPHEQEL